MHELSLVLRMLDLAEEVARAEGAERIDAIALDVGALAGAVPDALRFAFEGARPGTMAERARLQLTTLPAVAHCAPCDRPFEIDNPFGIAECPHCGAPSADIRQGFELLLRDVVVS